MLRIKPDKLSLNDALPYLKAFTKGIARAGNAVLEAVYPPRCLACGCFFRAEKNNTLSHPVDADFKESMRLHLCPECSEHQKTVEPPICPQCGLMLKNRAGRNRLCQRCLTYSRYFGKARAWGVYDHSLKTCIQMMKYQGRIEMGKPFGVLLFETFTRHWSADDVDIITPVPLHLKRFRKRGFNQAWMMIHRWPKLAEKAGFRLSESQVQPEILVRCRHTETQVGMTREKRMENLKDAFQVKNPKNVQGKRILLADDVFTTGATSEACAKTLLDAGAARVDVITLAQTPKMIDAY
jgi:ComF family protein